MTATELFYVLLGLASVALVFWVNRDLFRGARVPLSGAEAVYYVFGLAALLCGWYFNFAYFREYGADAGWLHWTRLLFVNSASASGAQDLIIANVFLFPMWTILDGKRHGMKLSGWYFVMSLITSYAFAYALFLAIQDRQIRSNALAPVKAGSL